MTTAESFFLGWCSSRWFRTIRLVGLLAAIILVTFLSTRGISSQSSAPATVTHLPIVNETLKVTSHIIVESNRRTVDMARLTITNLSTERPVRLDPAFLSVRYRDSIQRLDVVPWSWKFQGQHNGDDILDKGEHVQININVQEALTTPLIAGSAFLLELQPADGAILRIHRTIPPQLTPLMDLQ